MIELEGLRVFELAALFITLSGTGQEQTQEDILREIERRGYEDLFDKSLWELRRAGFKQAKPSRRLS